MNSGEDLFLLASIGRSQSRHRVVQEQAVESLAVVGIKGVQSSHEVLHILELEQGDDEALHFLKDDHLSLVEVENPTLMNIVQTCLLDHHFLVEVEL